MVLNVFETAHQIKYYIQSLYSNVSEMAHLDLIDLHVHSEIFQSIYLMLPALHVALVVFLYGLAQNHQW